MRKFHLFIFIFLLLAFACNEEKLRPLSGDNQVPEIVTNLKVDNHSGKVVITYDVPNSPGLLYVKAEYENRPGNKMESISSSYNNSIVLEGFDSDDERDVRIYTVSKAEVYSDPVVVKVKPLVPPVMKTFSSLDFNADFGGINIDYVNADTANIAIGVLTRNEMGDAIPSDMFYTAQSGGRFATRGFDAEERWFGLYVRDRWQNYSDTVWRLLTPYYEEQMDKSKFAEMRLPTDAEHYVSTGGFVRNLWNDKLTGGSSSSDAWYRSKDGSGTPHWISFDMGVIAKLSRFVTIPRGAFDELSLLYRGGDPQLFEVWGTAEDPKGSNGSFDGWSKLAECEVIKPSGLPMGTNSNDDILRAQEGHQFNISVDAPPVRYIRLKFIQTFGNATYSWMSQITFFGQVTQ